MKIFGALNTFKIVKILEITQILRIFQKIGKIYQTNLIFPENSENFPKKKLIFPANSGNSRNSGSFWIFQRKNVKISWKQAFKTSSCALSPRIIVLFAVVSTGPQLLYDNLSNCPVASDSCPNDNVTFWLYTRYFNSKSVHFTISTISTINFMKYALLPHTCNIKGPLSLRQRS